MVLPMKIILDARVLGHGTTSGISGYTYNLYEQLLKHSPQNEFVLYYSGLRKRELPSHWLAYPNVAVRQINVPNKLLDLSMRTIGLPMIERKTPADIIFSPHFNILTTEHTPRILTIHDISFIHRPDFFSNRQMIWHWLQNYREQINRAKHIITVSRFTKNDLIQTLGVAPEKISVVYSGIDASLHKLADDNQELLTFRKKYELTSPYLLYLGAFEPRKNIEALIKAFTLIKKERDFKDYKLVLVGKPGWQANQLVKQAQATNSKTDIVFLTNITDQERIFVYNGARVFIYPSFFEGFGFPPIEAQACGVPVIYGDRAALPEIIGESGIPADPWNVSKLAQTIISLDTNNTVRNTYIEKGLINSKRFNWTTAANQIRTIITDTHANYPKTKDNVRHNSKAPGAAA